MIDINSDIFPLEVNARYTIRITQTLVADLSAQKDEYDPVRPLDLMSFCSDQANGSFPRMLAFHVKIRTFHVELFMLNFEPRGMEDLL
jgi:hypothetical protein